MRDVCACCFVRVLQAATSSPNYYNLFPSPSSCSTTWRPVLDSFYDIARTLPMFPFESTKKLLRIDEIVFANENTCPELISEEIMKLSDLSIVRVEDKIVKTLTSGFPRIRVVSPDFVRKSFRELSVSSKAHDIFEYAIGDIRGLELARFYRNHVLVLSMSKIQSECRNRIFLQLLRSSNLFRFEEIGLKKALQSIAFVPRGGEKEELAKPSELFKPNSHELRDLLSARDFPCKEFCGLDVLGSLEDLGLQSKISRENILEIARHIETSARTCKEDDEINRLAQRSARLTEYIVAKQKQLELRRRKENASIFSMFKFGSNNEQVQKQERSDREYFNAICEIEFIPVLRESPVKDLPWRQTSSRFCSAQDVRPRRDIQICSASKSISALRTWYSSVEFEMFFFSFFYSIMSLTSPRTLMLEVLSNTL